MEIDLSQRTILGYVPKASSGENLSNRVSYNLEGKTRNLPVDQGLIQKLDNAASVTGDDISVVISSGGQFSQRQINNGSSGGRTGSTRHDINESGVSDAADVVLFQNGKQLDVNNNKDVYLQFAQNIAAEEPSLGFGHYAWGLHIDNKGGVWGPDTRSSSFDGEFEQALFRGKSSIRTRDLPPAQGRPANSKPQTQITAVDNLTKFAQLTSRGETGQTDLVKGSFQIANDTAGSKSYGFLGVNSGSGSATLFAKNNPSLGLTAKPGTSEFDRQWKKAANEQPDKLVKAQLDYLKTEVIKPGENALIRAGLNSFTSDPSVLSFVSDGVVQYGAGGIQKHIRAAAGAKSTEEFIELAVSSMKRTLKTDFRAYLKDNPNNLGGLENRINGRAERALSLKFDTSNDRPQRTVLSPSRSLDEQRTLTNNSDFNPRQALDKQGPVFVNDLETVSDIFEREQAERDKREGVSTAQLVNDFGAEFLDSQSLTQFFQNVGVSTNIDPNFELTPQRVIDTLKENNLPIEEFAPLFDNVRSEEGFNQTITEAVERKERQDRLGFSGTLTANLASAVLDPVALGAEALTFGASSPLVRGIQLGRLGRTGVTALQGGAVGASGALATGVVSNDLDTDDVLLSSALGAGIGGVIGALSRNPALLQEAARLQNIADDLQSGTSLSSSAGSRHVGTVRRDLINDSDLKNIRDEDVETAFGIRFDTIGRLKESKNPLSRLIFGSLAKDAAGARGDEVIPFSPTETLEQLNQEFTTTYKRVYNNQRSEYLNRNNVPLHKRDEATRSFHSEISDYIEDTGLDVVSRYDPAVIKVGDQIRKNHSELLKLLQNPRFREGDTARPIRGFDEIHDDPNYLTRVWNPNALSEARKVYGDTTIERLIEKAIQRQISDFDPKTTKAVSKAFTRSITNRALGFDDIASRPISVDSIDEITDILRDNGGLSKEDAEALLNRFKSKTDSGRVSVAKRRLLLDVSTELSPNEVARLDGGISDKPLRIKDLLVRDADYLHQRYIRQVSGRIALGKFRVHDPKTGDLIVDGITSDADFASLVRRVDKEGAERGVKQSQRDVDKDRAQFLYDYITGKPRGNVRPGSAADKVLEGILKFNFVRAFNQVGFAQIPEIANVIHATGVKAAFSQIPAFRRIINKNTGEELLENGLARDLEGFLFDGTDRVINQAARRYDDLTGDPIGLNSGSFGDNALNVLNKASRVTADISLLNGVNAALTRWTSKAIIQKFVDAAHTGKGLDSHRLRSLGLDQKMTDRILSELKKPENVITEQGFLTGNKVRRFNADAWQDREALEAFRNAAWRFGRTIIQRNDVGMLQQWMSTPTGRILAQFRTFAIGAYTNGLLLNLNRVKNGDLSALGWFMTSAALAGLTRAAQVQITSIGRDDREDYLDKQLDLDNIARASFSRSGYASILPMLLDSSVSPLLAGQPLFSFKTTQPSDTLFSNPTTDLIDSLSVLSKAATRPTIEGREVSQQELRSAVRALPFGNFIPNVLILNSLIGDLPERPPRN